MYGSEKALPDGPAAVGFFCLENNNVNCSLSRCLIRNDRKKANISESGKTSNLIVGAGMCQEGHGLQFVRGHGLHF